MAKRPISPPTADELTIRLRLTQQLAERDRRIQDLATKLAQMDGAYGDAIRLAEETMLLADKFARWIDETDPTSRQVQLLTLARLSQFARAVFGKLVQVSR